MTSPGGVALAGAVALDVQPEAREFYPRLRAQVLPAADAVGRDIGRQMSAPIAAQVGGATRDGVRDGARAAAVQASRAGEDIGTALSRTLKARVEAALKTMPDIKIDADSSAMERKAANIRRQLEELRDKRIGVDIDDEQAVARVQLLRNQLSQLARDVEKAREAGGDIPLNLDAIAAGVQITRLKTELREFKTEAARPTTINVQVGSFERDLKARIAAAQAQLPDIELRADSSDADREIASIRGQLATLLDKRIGVDIDAGQALAEVATLHAQLVALGERSPDIQVKADTAAAAGKIASVVAEAEAAGAIEPTITMDVDTGGAQANIAALVTSATAGRVAMIGLAGSGMLLATAIVPAAAAAAVAVAAIIPAAIAALGAIAVVVLAVSSIGGAMKALDEQQASAGKSAAQLASRQAAIAGAVDQVRSAEASLANTRASAADSSRRATQSVADAERSLAAAQQAARQAQLDLTAAREAGRRSLEDMNLAVKDGALAQRGALLDLTEARSRLDAVMTNPASTELERQRAQLSYDQAVQHVEDIRVRQQRLEADTAKANKAGVEGTQQVVAAQVKIVQTQDQAAKAEQALTTARQQQAAQERQNAFAIAQAVQGVAAAQRSLQQAQQQANDEGVAGTNKLAAAMGKLSPAGQAFAIFLHGLLPQLNAVRLAAETGLLPGLQAGLTALQPMLPVIARNVGLLAGAMGQLFAAAGQALASPFWVDFFNQLTDFAVPVIGQFGSIIGDLAKGFASLLLAFLPVSGQMVGGLVRLASSFATWAASVAQSDGFRKFIDYVTANSPALLALLGDLVVVAVKLGIGLAPLAKVALDVAAAIAGWLASLSPGQLMAVAAAIGAIGAAIGIAVGGPILWIAAGIALVVGALIYAWTHFETFRTVVLAVVEAVRVAAVWLWANVIQPYFGFIAAEVQVVAAIFMWLWQNVLGPVFEAIGAIVSWWWNNITKPVFDAVSAVVTGILVPLFLFFWHNVIEPVWQGISAAISIAWAIIQVIFGLMQIAIGLVAAPFLWFWNAVVEPVFRWIGDHIASVWHDRIQPILNALGGFIRDHVAPPFEQGITALSAIFERLRDAFKAPIRFVVETVLNDGLLGAYNWIASRFGVKPDNVQVALPKGFATGGFVAGPGGPRDDAILARLSNGEYIIPANIVARWGVEFFDALIGRGGVPAGVPRPGDGSQGIALPAFADGGLVGALKAGWNALKDPIGWLSGKVGGILDQIPGAGILTSTIASMGHKLIDGTLDYAKRAITNLVSADRAYQGPVSAGVLDVQNWIRGQAGKPYIWAGAGPEGFDCSGLVGSAFLALQGKNPNNRIFSTSDQAPFFPKPAFTGVLTAGWANPGEKGGGSVGHTSANLAGLAFEATPPRVLVGKVNAPVSSFAHTGSAMFDTGGWLMPGLTAAYNGTGRPEPILTAGQWDRLLSSRSEPSSTSTTYAIYPQQTTLDANQLQALVDRRDALARVGRQN